MFKRVEQGLKRNPNRPAVIYMFQPADHLKDLVFRDERVQQPNALWQQRLYNKPTQQVNGSLEHETNGHQNETLWGEQQKGLAPAVKHASATRNAMSNLICLTLSYS